MLLCICLLIYSLGNLGMPCVFCFLFFVFCPKATDPRSSIMWIIIFFVNYLCSCCLSKAKLVLVWKAWKQKRILEGKRHNLWANESHQELCEKGHMSLKDARSCVLITGKQSTFFKKKTCIILFLSKIWKGLWNILLFPADSCFSQMVTTYFFLKQSILLALQTFCLHFLSMPN